VWSGPSIDDVGNAWEDPAIRDLVARLAARRSPLDEAQKRSRFHRRQCREGTKSKADFAGLLVTLTPSAAGDERTSGSSPANGICDRIRLDIAELRELQDAPDHDQSRLDELANRIDWNTRIFEERRKTISYACEVPVLIERRLFALARAIQQSTE
jgi:hypothetical protein